jgi:hypothetical protein
LRAVTKGVFCTCAQHDHQITQDRGLNNVE